ncbi:MAG: hypothetical protein ACRDJU_01710, partial [Actinomycetota bacterium]
MEPRPRSIIPGRQRWEVGAVLGRPDIAEDLEASLRGSAGVTLVRANPITGRLLLLHTLDVSPEEIAQLLRPAVALVVQASTTEPRSAPVARAQPMPRPLPRPRETPSFLHIAGMAAVSAGALLLAPPMVRLGAVGVAAAAIVRREWQRSALRQEDWITSRSARRPIAQILGARRGRFYTASLVSVAGQLLELVPGVLSAAMASVLTGGTSKLLGSFGLTTTSGQLLFLGAATAATFGLVSLVAHASNTRWNDLAQIVAHDWRTRVYGHVQN